MGLATSAEDKIELLINSFLITPLPLKPIGWQSIVFLAEKRK
jgi:hypothetical protein